MHLIYLPLAPKGGALSYPEDMGCCFSHDSNEEHTTHHRPQTYHGANNSIQPYVVSNDSIIVSSPSLPVYNNNCSHAATTTDNPILARILQDNQKRITPIRPKTRFEADKRFKATAISANKGTDSPSSLQAHNSNSYNEPTSTRHSGRMGSHGNFRGGYSVHLLDKTRESTLHKSVLKLTFEWDHMNDSSEFELCLLHCGSTEYEEIFKLFKKTTQRQFMVEKIYRIQNPYLLGCYLLKKQELESRYGSVSEEFLFHGTKEENKDKICQNNFDWRMHGKSVGNMFGKGISFTPISCYASHYSEKCNTRRLMLVSKVLIAKETVGHRHMNIPPVFDDTQCLRYDTATKENRHVIVKFSDNEFYPSYIVYYTGQYERKELKRKDFNYC